MLTSSIFPLARSRMKIVLGCLVLVAILSACSTTPIRVASIKTPGSAQQTYNLVNSQAEKCWQTEVNPVRKGIQVSGRPLAASQFVVRAYPIHWGAGVEHKAFITVTIDQTTEGSVVTIDEGAHACTLTGCHTLGLADDVRHWIVGDLSCKDIKWILTREQIGI
jgi:hypothetical protein